MAKSPSYEMFTNLLPGYRTPCYKAGSSEPPRLEGFPLRCYGMRFCSDVYNVMLFMALKRIRCQIINIDLRSKPEWFLLKNPAGTVATLEDTENGTILTDTLAICEYLDKKHCQSAPLLAADESERQRQKQLMATYNRLDVYRKWLWDRENVELQTAVNDWLRKYDELLGQSDFIAGAKLSMVDVICWPFLERVCGFGECGYDRLRVTPVTHPHLSAYLTRMNSLPEVEFLRKPPRIFADYANGYTTREGNFDFALDIM